MHTAGKSAEEMKKMLKIGGKVNLSLHRKRDGIVQSFGKQGLYTMKLDIYFTRIAKQCDLTYSKNCSRA